MDFKKQAQVSNEFIILLGIVIITMMVFLHSISENISGLADTKEYLAVRDLGFSLQTEFLIAQQVNDGYVRTFDVPDSYHTFDYDITIEQEYLILTSVKNSIEHVFFIPEVNGVIQKGENTINKTGGVIYLN